MKHDERVKLRDAISQRENFCGFETLWGLSGTQNKKSHLGGKKNNGRDDLIRIYSNEGKATANIHQRVPEMTSLEGKHDIALLKIQRCIYVLKTTLTSSFGN